MESIRKALDITTSLTTNNDARRAFQLMPTLESERFQTLVHSYRRPTLTRSVSDPFIVTTKIPTHKLTETPIQHNKNSSSLLRFATMPLPSTTGRTPLTPNHNTVAIDSLRRTFNPISATNRFPDETPDTDRISSITEPAHFSDIDEDDPSPLNADLIPQIDHEMPTDTKELHRESPLPSSPHDGNDESPSMDDNALVINVTDTTELHQDVDTDPSPAMTDPPTAEHVSSFLLHISRRTADMTGDLVLGAATPADTADDMSRERTQNDASISGPGDDNVAGESVAIATDITADESTVTADGAADDTYATNQCLTTAHKAKAYIQFCPDCSVAT